MTRSNAKLKEETLQSDYCRELSKYVPITYLYMYHELYYVLFQELFTIIVRVNFVYHKRFKQLKYLLFPMSPSYEMYPKQVVCRWLFLISFSRLLNRILSLQILCMGSGYW